MWSSTSESDPHGADSPLAPRPRAGQVGAIHESPHGEAKPFRNSGGRAAPRPQTGLGQNVETPGAIHESPYRLHGGHGKASTVNGPDPRTFTFSLARPPPASQFFLRLAPARCRFAICQAFPKMSLRGIIVPIEEPHKDKQEAADSQKDETKE